MNKATLPLLRFSELGELEQQGFLDGMSVYLFGSQVDKAGVVEQWLASLRSSKAATDAAWFTFCSHDVGEQMKSAASDSLLRYGH